MHGTGQHHLWKALCDAWPVVFAILTGIIVITSRLTALETKVDFIYSALTATPGEVRPVPLRIPQQKHVANNPFEKEGSE